MQYFYILGEATHVSTSIHCPKTEYGQKPIGCKYRVEEPFERLALQPVNDRLSLCQVPNVRLFQVIPVKQSFKPDDRSIEMVGEGILQL